MKKALITFFVVSLLFTIAIVLIDKIKRKGDGEVFLKPEFSASTVEKMLPEQTLMYAKVKSVADLNSAFGLANDSLFGGLLKNVVDDVVEEVGLNLLSEKALEAKGFSSKGEFGILSTHFSINNRVSLQGSFTLFASLVDSSKVDTFIKQSFENTSAVFTKKDSYTLITDPYQDGYSATVAYIDSYLLFTFGVGESAAEKELKLLLSEGTKLTKSEAFSKTSVACGNTGTIFCYVNMKNIMEDNRLFFTQGKRDASKGSYRSNEFDIERYFQLVAGFESVLLNLDLGTKDLKINSAAYYSESNGVMTVGDVRMKKSSVMNVAKTPIIVSSTNLDLKEMLAMYSLKDEVEKAIEEVGDELGFDLKGTFYDNLGTSFGFGMYDASGMSMGSYNTMLSIGVKDEQLAKQGVASFLRIAENNLMPVECTIKGTKISAVDVYQISFSFFVDLFVCVHNKELLVATDRYLISDAVSGSADKGVCRNTVNKNIGAAIGKETMGTVLIDVEEGAVFIENLTSIVSSMSALSGGVDFPSHKEVSKVLSKITEVNYLVATSIVDKNTVVSQLGINTDFSKPFIPGFYSYLSDLEKVIGTLDK